MPLHTEVEAFGAAAQCCSLAELEDIIRNNPGVPKIRLQAAAYGLALVAAQAVGEAVGFNDTLLVLDEMARAKARLDIAAWHDLALVRATAAILLAAQAFVDEQTIPCIDWPMPREVADIALKAARTHAAT
ncbi:MAG: hypothetical protein ABWY06_17735 [Pseudomonas sp.]|uniref:hypothetical protein n=1 Tax=Pseudomonas sp. TaxID=306 RepID=UPI0033954A5D